MKIGLQIIRFDWPGSPANTGATLAQIARTADEAGFASLWVMDHFFQIRFSGPSEDPMLEGYSAASFVAAATRRASVGVLVTGVQYRHPGVLIKTVTTLDVLSGGRAYFGIGAGWFEHESRGLGVPFPPLATRFAQLEETLRLAKQMWADDRTPFRGQHYQLEDPLCHPQPLRRPHPPIMIGGEGERKTLRLVAQYGDACNVYGGSNEAFLGCADGVRHKLAVLEQHCATLGRPYAEIERTVLATVQLGAGGVSVADVLAACERLHNIGVQHIIFNMPDTHMLAPLEVFGREIIPLVRAWGT
ncbi:MAG: LLM class F420-dependent oxidoreductase [Chloroflexaceae bacterium]|nr:LLM class F420-dependent oxidoreductase [Chloroflexaceae bacterium]